MNTLILNPNTSLRISQILHDEARCYVTDSRCLKVANVTGGVEYISTPLESIVATNYMLQYIADNHERFDCIIVGAFGDPGVQQIRRYLEIPIIGLTGSSLAHAKMLRDRVSLISLTSAFREWYSDVISSLGYNSLVSQYLSAEVDMEIAVNRDRIKLARAAVDIILSNVPRQNAVVLAGAPWAGIANMIAGQIPNPVFDGVESSLLFCNALYSSRNKVEPNKKVVQGVKNVSGLLPAVANFINAAKW
ncbi:aspartate/glutamate racemase family protein [Acidithiobacillus sp. IBUN Pt1247-S3]|uniref:aspartate/glutamate racemase family protein n=1 Tax=Acidithiobacillus sp. IBUN Pt1247-S3 TaxID=3166642 RepID=UPI0034E49F08